MAQHPHSRQGPSGGPGAGGQAGPSGDGKDKEDIIDAEFEVKK